MEIYEACPRCFFIAGHASHCPEIPRPVLADVHSFVTGPGGDRHGGYWRQCGYVRKEDVVQEVR